MLYILLSVIVILPVLAGFGEIFQRLFGKVWPGLSAKIFSGMFFLGGVWQILAFFIPLNFWVESFSLAIGLFTFLFFKTFKDFSQFNKNEISKLLILVLIIIFAGSYFIFILDHFGYYVPSIEWLQGFGLTRGLANLNLIYAQMSVWHVFQTGFSHIADVFLRINVVFIIVYYFYIFEKKAWCLLFISPVFLMFLQAPSPDLPAIALSLIILNEVIQNNKNFKLLFAFSIFIFTIKPTMVWLPIFVLLYFFKQVNFKSVWLGLFIGLIYIFKNIWLFGYPFFPVKAVDLNVFWLPNVEILKQSSQLAIMKAYDLEFTILEIKKFTTWSYIYNWFTLDTYKKYINIAFVVSFILFGIYTWKKKNKLVTVLFISLLIKSILVISFSAQYRFFIDVFLVNFLVVFNDRIKEKYSFLSFGFCSLFILFIFSFPKVLQTQVPSFRLGHYMGGFVTKQIYKPANYKLNSFESYKIGNLHFNVPNYDLCFDTPQPSISPDLIIKYHQLGVFPQKISKNLEDGFFWKKLSFKEKRELKKIVKILLKKSHRKSQNYP